MARSFNKFLANYGARNNVAFSSEELMQEIYADVTVALHEGNRQALVVGYQQAPPLQRRMAKGNPRREFAKSLSLTPSFTRSAVLFSGGGVGHAGIFC